MRGSSREFFIGLLTDAAEETGRVSENNRFGQDVHTIPFSAVGLSELPEIFQELWTFVGRILRKVHL